MNQGIRWLEVFFAGWILALTTYYLGALDTGRWIPFVVTGVEILGLILIIAGIRQIADQHKNYKAAGIVAIFALVVSLGMGFVQTMSLEGISGYLSIAAICLAITGDILFMVLTGLVLLGLNSQIRQAGNEREANRLTYLWAIFLTFAILYLIIQVVAVLLVNEGLAALTYIVPATGIPMLIVGVVVIVWVYRFHAAE
jgi:hypothetical protein